MNRTDFLLWQPDRDQCGKSLQWRQYKDPLYLTEDVVKQMKRLPYVTDVYPVLRVDVLLQQGKYSSNVTLNGMPYEYLKNPAGPGRAFDPSDKELKLIYGNAIIQWFMDSKGNNIVLGHRRAVGCGFHGKAHVCHLLIQIPTTSPRAAERTHQAAEKVLLKADGVVEGGVDDYNSYAYNVYTRLDLLETQLKKIFKKRAIPGQPTNKKRASPTTTLSIIPA